MLITCLVINCSTRWKLAYVLCDLNTKVYKFYWNLSKTVTQSHAPLNPLSFTFKTSHTPWGYTTKISSFIEEHQQNEHMNFVTSWQKYGSGNTNRSNMHGPITSHTTHITSEPLHVVKFVWKVPYIRTFISWQHNFSTMLTL